MTQTNQNKDYKWLREVFDLYDARISGVPEHWPRTQLSKEALGEAVNEIRYRFEQYLEDQSHTSIEDFIRWYNGETTNPTITFEQLNKYYDRREQA